MGQETCRREEQDLRATGEYTTENDSSTSSVHLREENAGKQRKITFVCFSAVQHSNSQNFFTGDSYNFLGSHFKGGQDFMAVNLLGAKIFGL